tara:strand:+ start:262 stop:447 length:186 start_codon:yes stop_codon:yes gene_type:complete
MADRDPIERNKYAHKILSNLGIRPLKVDVVRGILQVPTEQIESVQKICLRFGWALHVLPLP